MFFLAMKSGQWDLHYTVASVFQWQMTQLQNES